MNGGSAFQIQTVAQPSCRFPAMIFYSLNRLGGRSLAGFKSLCLQTMSIEPTAFTSCLSQLPASELPLFLASSLKLVDCLPNKNEPGHWHTQTNNWGSMFNIKLRPKLVKFKVAATPPLQIEDKEPSNFLARATCDIHWKATLAHIKKLGQSFENPNCQFQSRSITPFAKDQRSTRDPWREQSAQENLLKHDEFLPL